MLKIREEGRVSMDAVRMEESGFSIAEDYMKLMVWIRRVFGSAGGFVKWNDEQDSSSYWTVHDARGCADEFGEDVGGCGEVRTKSPPPRCWSILEGITDKVFLLFLFCLVFFYYISFRIYFFFIQSTFP